MATTNHSKRLRKRNQKRFQSAHHEQGIALVMALLMGTVLMGGATALVVRMIGARKLGASESYQQLAEAAAVNGFNRILASLNASSRQGYLGYLYLISNEQSGSGGYTWDNLPSISEPCAPKLSIAPDWHSTTVPLQGNGETLRDDLAGNITTHYRLRRYVGPQQGSSARFEVEGIAKREGSDQSFEARSLLNRSLFINSRVPTEHDWAVLAARDYDLSELTLQTGGSNINTTGGMILKLLRGNSSFDSTISDSCGASNLLALVGAPEATEIAKNIWPVKNISNNDWDIPTPEYFNGDNTTDTTQNNGAQRIWAFDDSLVGEPSDESYGINCNGSLSPVCSRPASNNPSSQHNIPISEDQVSATHTESSTVKQKCFNKRTWSNNNGKERLANTVFANQEKCNSIDNKWTERVEWRDTNVRSYKILLKDTDLCTLENNTLQGNVCHIYIEHINLKRSTLYIENSSERPIVLHLETPAGAARRSDLSGQYELSGSSLICGVNQINGSLPPSNGVTACNNKPELLILASSDGDPTTGCNGNSISGTFRFGGMALPAAMINMPNGNVELNAASTTTKAVIWANSICTGNGQRLTLDTTGSNNQTSIIVQAEQQWQWPEEKRYGRTIVRGIRGTGFDTFSRW
jgi:hypothetical protein